MKRQVSIEEISDGRLYTRRDLVRAGCNGCKGCSECCGGMGESVILDPLDLYRMAQGLGCNAGVLLEEGKIELNVVDGLILPNLKMRDGEEKCAFLNTEGRCSIHPFRPGICRLFPLGRYYPENEKGFRYFLQVHECPMPNKTKVRIERWMDMPGLAEYEEYVNAWHYFLEDLQTLLPDAGEEMTRNISLYLLKMFYLTNWTREDFYIQFYRKLKEAREVFGIEQ